MGRGQVAVAGAHRLPDSALSANSGAARAARSSAALDSSLDRAERRGERSRRSRCVTDPWKCQSTKASRCGGGSCATAAATRWAWSPAAAVSAAVGRLGALPDLGVGVSGPRRTPSHEVDCTVLGDADQPGARLCAAGLVLRRVPPEGDEDVLGALLCQLPVAEQSLGHPEHDRAVALVEDAERIGVIAATSWTSSTSSRSSGTKG